MTPRDLGFSCAVVDVQAPPANWGLGGGKLEMGPLLKARLVLRGLGIDFKGLVFRLGLDSVRAPKPKQTEEDLVPILNPKWAETL